MFIEAIRRQHHERPVALILGTGDIASAIAADLFLSQWAVVMLRDEAMPVMRRGMAFDDALEEGVAWLDGVWGTRAIEPEMLLTLARARESVVVSALDPAVVTAASLGLIGLLIDARMRKYAPPADLRSLATCAIGVGPGFVAGQTVDVAIETLPGHEGEVVSDGGTACPTGKSVPLGGVREERFVCAVTAGPWTPTAPLGALVEPGARLGRLGDADIHAPIGGRVRGIVRPIPRGVARGCKLAEIDPRPDAPITGVPPRAERIAAGVRRAVRILLPFSYASGVA